MLDEVRRRADEFDVLHFHIDVLHFPLIAEFADRTVTTLHGRLDLPDLQPCFAAFPTIPLVSISRHQRTPLARRVLWVGNVYHGLPTDLLRLNAHPAGDYFAFLGRISPEKRPDRAIEIAARAGVRLKIAAKIDRADEAYWREKIGPMVAAHPNVEFIGEISDDAKAGVSRQCPRPAVSDRLARAFRPRDDRSNGLRYAGHCVSTAARCPKSSTRASRASSSTTSTQPWRAVQRIERLRSPCGAPALRERFTVEHMARDYLEVYRRLPGFGLGDGSNDSDYRRDPMTARRG